MLQIKDIRKEYRTGGLVQKALDGVSLNFRDNEFVAILGPSGSGKTTLLNIIGGLDRYDSGDLVINAISTKKYKDRDWDSYRNHTIGFVFQSYNLIPHQSVLSNVELALTLGGISRSERRRRAKEALEKVGLGDQTHKLPSQMSGGQMQRVAIARALVNDPDILLADEPTGALDSDTSVQVMELLKEVARDRLVIMVTHNPELANEYATRIVELRDGQIRSDSDPFIVTDNASGPPVHRNMGKSSMSFLTALQLSFNNLLTKKARTLLVAFAGSIGIIGIALILALSNGVNKYIADVEEDTLSEYPMEIQNSTFSLAALMEGFNRSEDEEEYEVREIKTITSLLSRMSSNDLASLKTYLETDGSYISDYAKSIRYSYNVTPLLYIEKNGRYRQINPYSTLSALGGGGSSFYGFSSAFSVTELFHEMPPDRSLYINQYDVKAGRWPEKYNECVLALTQNGRVSDLTLFAMNMKDDTSLEQAVKSYMAGEDAVFEEEEPLAFKFEDFIGISFKLIHGADCYSYDSQYKVWTSKLENNEFMQSLAKNGEDMTIVGVVRPKEDGNGQMLSNGLNYPYGLTEHIIEYAAGSDIVKAQLLKPDTDVFSGEAFGTTPDAPAFDMSSLFSVDQDALNDAFAFEPDSLYQSLPDVDISTADIGNIDPGSFIDAGSIAAVLPDFNASDVEELLDGLDLGITEENIQSAVSEITAGFNDYIEQNTDIDLSALQNNLTDFLNSAETRQIVLNDIRDIMSSSGSGAVSREDLTELNNTLADGFREWMAANELNDPAQLGDYINEYFSSDAVSRTIESRLDEIMKRAAAAEITEEDLAGISDDLMAAYNNYASGIELPDPEEVNKAISDYLASNETAQIIEKYITDNINADEISERISQAAAGVSAQVASAVQNAISGVISSVTNAVSSGLYAYMEQFMSALVANMENAFSFDPDSFRNAISMNMNEKELSELLSTMMVSDSSSYDANLKTLGYADLNKPYEILIYPKNFESKDSIVLMLDNYNQSMKDSEQDEKVITYTDMVGTLMSSVTIIINAISYVLIAFVSISLIVSSIMIGVITYISVLERRKEIGILRSIGASKHNISSVFNAETFITGLLAGVLGTGITMLLLIPANHILRVVTDQQNLSAFLPVGAAVILIALSVVLTLTGGLIPSRKAAKSDPVSALRNE